MDEKMVKSPKHYTEGRKFEPKDVIRDWRLNFNMGSAVKYLARAGRKDDIIQDLSKAKEYIDFEIAAIKEDRAKGSASHVNCKCVADPTPKSEVKQGVIVLDVPVGVPTEEIIQMAIKKIMGEN